MVIGFPLFGNTKLSKGLSLGPGLGLCEGAIASFIADCGSTTDTPP